MPRLRRVLRYALLAALLAALAWTVSVWAINERRLRPLAGPLSVTDPALAAGEHTFRAGSFQIVLSASGKDAPEAFSGPRLFITHERAPGRWLWHNRRGEAFAAAASGVETVEESRGSYFITDQIGRACTHQTIDRVEQFETAVEITGSLSCDDGSMVDYALTFSSPLPNHLAFSLTFDDPAVNRAYLTCASDSDERFFGFGEQFSRFDQKGRRVPVWVSEQGIGRGRQPVTALVNLAARAGGTDMTTYAAAPHYVTSRMRSLFLETGAYSVFDLRDPDRVQISIFSNQMYGRILYGEKPEALISEYTLWAGRMRPLPDWILSGAVVGMQGGTQRVREVAAQLRERGTPVAAFWLQDWVGQRATSFGKQLWWNWELDEDRYPEWPALRSELESSGARVMVYVSPFLADVAGLKPNMKRNLFAEAEQAGYLVRRPDGQTYRIQNTDFSAGLVDLTNPQAARWFQSVIEEQVIQGAGASGWMADFGEALPYDALLFDGQPAADFHNRYPEAWARLNRELIDGLPGGEELVFFTRSGYAQSPAYTTLMWAGDQLVSWDEHDGMRSALTGMLTGGMSGFSLNHADIGGYTGINNPLLKVRRERELLLRWMELAAFTPVYRTHEGNTPDQNAQFYTDHETLAHFDRFARVYRAWGGLRRRLVDSAAETGVPVMRPLFLHYPDDGVSLRPQQDQFLLGPDLLVAPVMDPGAVTRRLYLPPGNWVHAWSGAAYRSPFAGQWVTVDAPLGQPPVFVREGSEDGQDFLENLRNEGLIP